MKDETRSRAFRAWRRGLKPLLRECKWNPQIGGKFKMSQWVMIFAAILLNVGGHVFLKAGMNRTGVINPMLLISDFKRVFFTTPFVLLGICSYVASVALYMVVLSRTYLSFAYPLMMSTGYLLIVIFSWQVFKEPFSFYKWIGMGLILVGVVLIGK